MSDHRPRTIERHCDVVVIGGSAAGLAAALQLARQRRSVIVIDAGEPRNAPAAHMHSYLGHDGVAPSDFAAIAREEVRSYGVEVLAARALDVTRRLDDGFDVALTGGHTVRARRVLAATGLIDDLPDIAGLAEQWGRGVIHCPFCHGYEVRDQRLVQIVTAPLGLHVAGLFRQLTDRLTLVLHDGVEADHPELEALRAAGVAVVDERVQRVHADEHGRVVAVELGSAARLDADAVVIGTRFRPRVDAFATLGLGVVEHATGFGQVVETDPAGETAIPGVYAAGNVTDPSHQMLQAAADGSRVGAMISFSLAHDDLEADVAAAAHVAAHQADWDHRYSGGQLWSGNPNGSLVNEVTGMPPGRALDVGAGEGGDAVWLAEQGWEVTANDVSLRATDRIAAVADDRGLSIVSQPADANGRDPFGGAQFDLVTAHYASVPRTPDHRFVDNIVEAVAPGGVLLVVGHDLAPMRRQTDPRQQSRVFDPDAYERVEDVAAVLTDAPGWHIEVHETRSRPPGHIAQSHHVDDVVLRARRTA